MYSLEKIVAMKPIHQNIMMTDFLNFYLWQL